MTTSRLAPSFLPATAVLELTYRCNHRCLFCSCPWEAEDGAFDRRAELSTAEWKTVISTLTGMGAANLSFSGGEPLMREDCFELIEHALGCTVEHIETRDGALQSHFGPPKVYLLSNGRAVDERVLAFCQEHDVQLSMSLPGLEALHAHTGYDSADHVLAQFSAAKKRGMRTVVNVTVTKQNLPELRETISAAFLAGASQLLLNRFLPGGRGLKYREELMLSAAEIAEMLNIAEDVLLEARAFGSVGAEIPRCLIPPREFKQLTIGTRCAAALSFYVIDPSGYARACNHSPVRLEHYTEIEKLKDNAYWRAFTQKQYLPEACYGCAQFTACDGGCREAAHIVGGDLRAHDPVFGGALPPGLVQPGGS